MTIIDVGLMVTWRKPDGSTEELPATVAFGEDEHADPVERWADAAREAIRHNVLDFPDEVRDATPVTIEFEEES